MQAIAPIRGETLPAVPRLAVLEDASAPLTAARWVLRGATSNERYVTRTEHDELARRERPLGRPEATRATLIPITKSAGWWALSQHERRALFEERSRHIAIGLEYLPDIARRLHHGRDLGEPFDFLTWFEYAPAHAGAFAELVRRLRATAEWGFVEREVEIHLARE